MTQKQTVNGIKTRLTFDIDGIKKIIGTVISENDDILGVSGNSFTEFADRILSANDVTKGINVEMGTKQLAVDVAVVCLYKTAIPQVFEQLVEDLTDALRYMTGLDMVECTMNVIDVMTKAEYAEKYRTKPMRSTDNS